MTVTSNHPVRSILFVCPENLSASEAALAQTLAGTTDLILLVPEATTNVSPPSGSRVIGWRTLRKMSPRWQPDVVLYASPPPLSLHWKTWWWKRRRAPGALLGGFWPIDMRGANTGYLWRWSEGAARQSLDFWLAEDEAAVEKLAQTSIPRARIFLVDRAEAGAASTTNFLEARLQAEDRSVLWVDDDLSLNSPSTKHLVYSVPHLRAEGWEVRGWCLSADETTRRGIEIRDFPAPPAPLRLFAPYWFFAAVNFHGVAQTILKGRPPARIVHAVGGAFLGADMTSIQFVSHVWLRRQIELGPRSFKDVAMLGMTFLGVCKDQLQFSNPRCRLFLPASDSIGEEVRRRCLLRAEVQTLANSYDETRFNPAVRQQWREPMRRDLGFGPEDKVFSFASQGHYKRKGFWLAVEALARLRRQGVGSNAHRIKFLIVGGQPRTLERLQADLAARYPDWQEWMVFVGSQRAVERYLSAADAFLFPSYFEAFCLAEIEAGALGLSLLLTAHPGTEMILQDGVNGMRLSENLGELTARVGEFLERGLPPFAASAGRALDRSAYARALAKVYKQWLAQSFR